MVGEGTSNVEGEAGTTPLALNLASELETAS